jgi:hypothetical protein
LSFAPAGFAALLRHKALFYDVVDYKFIASLAIFTRPVHHAAFHDLAS